MNSVYWFRKDLRLHDIPAFKKACLESSTVIPLFIINESLFDKTAYGFTRSAASKLLFLYQSLEDLKKSLQDFGLDLLVIKAAHQEAFKELFTKHHIDKVYFSEDIAHEEKQQELWLRQNFPDKKFVSSSDNYVFNHSDFEASSIKNSFTSFRKKFENKFLSTEFTDAPLDLKAALNPAIDWQSSLNPQDLISGLEFESDPRSAFPFYGGEVSALARIQYYLYESQKIKSYKETRNSLIGADFSSKFSPWLANGGLSVKLLMHEIKKFEAEFGSNQSSYWLKFELLWREFFKLIYYKHGLKLFQKSTRTFDKNKFQEWQEARTGNKFIDAAMTELNLTGYMSNRARQNAASYLVHDLACDYRAGAYYFESRLIDYDVFSNWANWQYIAGEGYNANTHIFDIEFQQNLYDKDASFRKTWLD